MKFKVGHICEKEWGQCEQSLETESAKTGLLDCYAMKVEELIKSFCAVNRTNRSLLSVVF